MKFDSNKVDSLLNELRRDRRDGEDFNACWRRTSQRRHEMVRDLGADGVRLWNVSGKLVRSPQPCEPFERAIKSKTSKKQRALQPESEIPDARTGSVRTRRLWERPGFCRQP